MAIWKCAIPTGNFGTKRGNKKFDTMFFLKKGSKEAKKKKENPDKAKKY